MQVTFDELQTLTEVKNTQSIGKNHSDSGANLFSKKKKKKSLSNRRAKNISIHEIVFGLHPRM